MSETAQVNQVNNDFTQPWWSRLFFIREGKKLSLNVAKAKWVLLGIATLIVASQCLIDTSSSIGTNPVSSSELVLTSRLHNVVALTGKERDARSSNAKSNAAPVKFTGAKVISRPKDLSKIPPGSLFHARLLTGASNGIVRAEVTLPLVVKGESFIETGAVVVGSGNSTEERLFINFNQVVFRDGSVGEISGQACDLSDKIVGLKGNKLGNHALNLAGSIGLGFVGGFSEGLLETEGQQGVVIRKPTIKNALLNATAKTALERSQNLMSDLKNRAPVIEIPEGLEICIIVAESRA